MREFNVINVQGNMIEFLSKCNRSSDNQYCINDLQNCEFKKTYLDTEI